MAKETTYAGMRGYWQWLITTMKANASDLGHLESKWAKLDALLTQSVEINKQQAALIASKQDLSKQLQDVMGEGQRLATMLRVSIKEHYGIRSEKLAEFGVQPFRGRLRKAKPAPEEPEETTPAR